MYYLGKKPATYDPRDLAFSSFKLPGATFEQAPIGFGAKHESLVRDWGMLGNGPDNTVAPNFGGCGDCVLADAGHAVEYSNAMAGRTVLVTGKQAVADYSTLTGYVLNEPSTDKGTDMRAALNFRRTTGTLAADGARHKIGGYCSLQVGDWAELLQALAVFDLVSIGFKFPSSAMAQFTAGQMWTYVATSPIDGGHDVPVIGRPAVSELTCVTWGQVQQLTRSFYQHLNDESYGVFMPESMVAGKGPEGFDMAAYQAALAAL